jgi:peptide/nickel transport system permease protein
MKKYLIKRLLLVIPTFIGITFITYMMIRIAPGEYTQLRGGAEGQLKSGSIGKEIFEQEKKLFGLNDPIPVGYAKWLSKLVRLDFGTSRVDGRPVSTRIAESLPITLALNIITIIIVYIISIPIGILSAVKKDTLYDKLSSILLFILYSLPEFWIALILLLVFSSGDYLNIFPLGNILSDWAEGFSFWGRLSNMAWHLVLPVITLTYGSFAFLSRFTRANMLEVINQQYITTARSKGLSERKVIFVHAFRNSLIPLVTLMASLLPALLGGSIIVESIFSIPGMGMLSFNSIFSRDIPVIMAIEAISAMLTLISFLLADFMYAVFDPRIKLEA